MKLGICLRHYGRPIEVPRNLEVARHAEAQGLDSVWVTDHVIVPTQTSIIYRDPAILQTIDVIAERLRPQVAD
jgi:alkanesulfonate monooxygenase SsuD/methylene tetrahydromethanopterin reductase-like flavin-dependent oxidoreductase (luciferase family)